MAGEVETAKDAETQGVATRWLREIDLASAHEKNWRERAEKIVKRYRDDDRKGDDGSTTSRFNILFANTEVLKGVMYQKTPVPDVRRRFLDKDPIGRQAAQILQRALSYSVDTYDFDGLMMAVVEDVLLPGRGVARVRYVPTTAKQNNEDAVVYQEVSCDYVEWEMYRESPAKRPSKIRWKAYGELMTREDLVRFFGDKGRLCALDWSPKDKENENDEMFKRALVWAIWDKTSKKIYFVSKGYKDDCLAVEDDPLQLEGFFPSPHSVYSVTTTNSLIPVPEYIQYQDQAIELDNITARIDALVDQLRVRGIDGTNLPEVEKLAKAGDGEMIPVEDAARLASIMENGGLEKAILFWPIETISNVLVRLYEQREQVKQTIYEITGIADIVRGSTKSSETLGAQELKARYANVRVGPRQKLIANFARDIFRMKAELIAQKFTPEVLKLMTGPEMWLVETDVPGPDGRPVKQKVDATKQIMELLRNDKLRGFRVDIETDSTVQPDATEEQKNRIEMLGAVSQFITGIGPAVQAGQIPKEVALEFLSFGIRGFKMSPQIEEAIDRMKGEDRKDQPPQIPPEVQAEQVKQQAEDRRMQAQQQAEGMKLQAQGQLESAKLNAQQQKDAATLEAQKVLEEMRLASTERIEQMKILAQERREAAERDLKLRMHQEDLAVQRETARLSAEAKAKAQTQES